MARYDTKGKIDHLKRNILVTTIVVCFGGYALAVWFFAVQADADLRDAFIAALFIAVWLAIVTPMTSFYVCMALDYGSRQEDEIPNGIREGWWRTMPILATTGGFRRYLYGENSYFKTVVQEMAKEDAQETNKPKINGK